MACQLVLLPVPEATKVAGDGNARSYGGSVGSADASRCARHGFRVVALDTPQSMLRLLGLFAQQAYRPVSIVMRRAEAGIKVSILQDDLDDHRANVILEKMRVMPDVTSASLRRQKRT